MTPAKQLHLTQTWQTPADAFGAGEWDGCEDAAALAVAHPETWPDFHRAAVRASEDRAVPQHLREAYRAGWARAARTVFIALALTADPEPSP